jgi:hypothetical protein
MIGDMISLAGGQAVGQIPGNDLHWAGKPPETGNT